MPNYLGTQSGFTGIPSLLISGLSQIQDQTTQTALLQVQNWANSFKTINWDIIEESSGYTTGGVVFDFGLPYDTEPALVASALNVSGASQTQITSLGPKTAAVALYTPTGTQLTAGAAYGFTYIAFGG